MMLLDDLRLPILLCPLSRGFHAKEIGSRMMRTATVEIISSRTQCTTLNTFLNRRVFRWVGVDRLRRRLGRFLAGQGFTPKEDIAILEVVVGFGFRVAAH